MVAYSVMEKRKPTYALVAIKAAIGSPETLSITSSALSDAVKRGFDPSGIAARRVSFPAHFP